MECLECNARLYDESDGSYYENDNYITKYIAWCPKCGTVYEYEVVTPVVKSTIRNFRKQE